MVEVSPEVPKSRFGQKDRGRTEEGSGVRCAVCLVRYIFVVVPVLGRNESLKTAEGTRLASSLMPEVPESIEPESGGREGEVLRVRGQCDSVSDGMWRTSVERRFK